MISIIILFSGQIVLSRAYIISYNHNGFIILVGGGRTVVHTAAQLMLQINPILFDVINSIMYLILLNLMLYLADVRRHKGIYLFVTHMCLLYAVPEYGQCFLWLTGSCNYLFGMILSLLPIVVYTRYYRKRFQVRIPLLMDISIFVICFLGGWSQENTGCIAILLCGCLLYASYKKYCERPARWMYIGILALVSGYLMLILAPGNYVRQEAMADSNILMKFIKNIISATRVYFENCIVLFIILVILFTFLLLEYRGNFVTKEFCRQVTQKAAIYILCSCVAMYILIVAYVATRAMVCSIVMLIIAVLGIADVVSCKLSELEILIGIVAVLLIPNAAIEFREAYRDISLMTSWWNSVEDVIDTEKEKGNRDIVVDNYILPATKYTPYESEYLNVDVRKTPNIYICRYYDIDTIRITRRFLIRE